MKNVLIYNYNLTPENIEETRDGVSFYIDYVKYYFKVCNRPTDDLESIATVLSHSLKYHRLIPNRFSSFVTNHNGKDYCLFKTVGALNNEVDILDIINNMTTVNYQDKKLLRTNWQELWSAKVDYLEYQISELGMTHPVVRHSFSYYVGLAENAIEYFNSLKPTDLEVVVSHRRLAYPLFSKDYNDPLGIVLDYKPRDLASYIKAKFFEEDNTLDEVKLIVNKNILTPLEYNLLFCRLLYPSYYFDALQEVLEKNVDDDILLKYIEKTSSYEEFLQSVYSLFKTKSSMLKIDWLIKEN